MKIDGNDFFEIKLFIHKNQKVNLIRTHGKKFNEKFNQQKKKYLKANQLKKKSVAISDRTFKTLIESR